MRRISTKLLSTCGALLLGATLASAQNADRNTVVTFSAPVALPGVTLPAGSYLFKLADSQVNRNIVQVFDKDRTKILATIIAIPAQRNEPADETVITFKEAPANAAPAIQYWYYPGEKSGQEFAYSRKQAIEIANAAHTSVLSTDSDDVTKAGNMSRVEPGAAMAESAAPAQPAEPAQTQPATPSTQPATPPANEPKPEAAAPAAPVTERAPAPAPAPATTQATVGTSGNTQAQPAATTGSSAAGRSGSDSLPKTGSTLPLIGFAGLMALAAACGVRALRRVNA